MTTGSASSITETGATLGGEITDTGGVDASERGIYWSTSNGFADGAGTKVSSNGTYGAGSFTESVTGLTAGTVYYFKAFATNSEGTSYGSQGTFTTSAPEIDIESPIGVSVGSGGNREDLGTVTVNATADFEFLVANSGTSNLTVSGISFSGTNSADFSVVGNSTATIAAGGNSTFTIRFTPGGVGARSATVTFANNDADEGSYAIGLTGNGSSSATTPTVTTSAADSITASAATLNGNVNSDGGAAVSARGFVYSSSDATPTIGEGGVTNETSGSGTGVFSSALSGLSANTTYYVQAYATNSEGTSYGGVQSFTTLKAEPAAHATGFGAGTITTSNIPAAWSAASPNPDGYLLKVSNSSVADPVDGTDPSDDTDVSDGSGVVHVTPGSASSYGSFSGFVAGETYSFKLYPYNNSGSGIDYKVASAPGFSAELLPVAPASAPGFASVTATGFTVSWDAVTGADSYELDLATDSGFTSMVSGYDGKSVAGTSEAVTGLSANSTYYARVAAVNTAGTGAFSATGNETTSGLGAPTATDATSVGATGFTANWSAVTGATGYRLDVYSSDIPSTTDLIISEYVEGSSNNKYVEIYNGSGSTVDLSDYELQLFTNGAASASSTQDLSALSGGPSTLAHGGTLVLKNSSAALTLPDGVTAYSSSAVNFNGDDALAIYKVSTTSYVDIFGVIGTDPGSDWGSGDTSTADKTQRRKTSVSGGVTTNPASFSTLSTEWDGYAQDTVSGLGFHGSITYLGAFENFDTGDVTSYAVTGATAGTTYQYVVRATSANSTSADSNEISVTTLSPPSAPTLSAASSPTATGFTINWADVADETSYELRHSASKNMTSPTSVTGISANATSQALTGLSEGLRYVQVRAVNGAGNSTWSTVQANQLMSVPAGGTRYVSVPGSASANTVNGIFGSANEAGLAGGATFDVATNIQLLDGDGATANTIYWDTDVNQWREGVSDMGATAIAEGVAFILKNNTGSTDYILLVGTPRESQPTVSINTAGNYTLLTSGRTQSTALADLNLNPGTGAGQFKAATKPTEADRVVLIDEATGAATNYWYNSNAGAWYDGLREATGVNISAGEGFFIKRASDSTFGSWTMPAE